MHANVVKWGRRSLAVLLTLLAIYYIYHKISREQISLVGFPALLPLQWVWLGMALLLSPANLAVEAYKWRMTFRGIFPMPFRMAWKGIFLGATVSFLMPNRLGEYATRILVMPPRSRVVGLSGGFLNSLVMMLVMMSWGSIAAWHALTTLPRPVFPWPSPVLPGGWYGIIIGGILVPGLIFLLLRYVPAALRWIVIRWKISEAKIRQLVSRRIIARVFFLTVARVTIYHLQLYLLLRAGGIDLPLHAILWLMPAFFFWTTVLPTFSVIDLPVRGVVGLWLFLPPDANPTSTTAILWATTLLWGINVFLPAIIGLPMAWRLWQKKPTTASSHI